MNFALSEDQEALRDVFARFTTERIKPRAAEIDESHEFPRELFMELAELGFFGLRYPESFGGVNLDMVSY
jgi:alkylation response protein AidB-like acyl-CoA dehydrogenase